MFVSLFRTFVKKGMELCSVLKNGDQRYEIGAVCAWHRIALHFIAMVRDEAEMVWG